MWLGAASLEAVTHICVSGEEHKADLEPGCSERVCWPTRHLLTGEWLCSAGQHVGDAMCFLSPWPLCVEACRQDPSEQPVFSTSRQLIR